MAQTRWTQSVVVTLALFAGCDKGSGDTTTTAADSAKSDEGKADTSADDWTQQERVEKNDDGTCTRYISVRCPEGVMCNPPPPEQIDCPPELGGSDPKGPTGATGTPKAKEPLFELVAGNTTTRVNDDGTCTEYDSVDCAPGDQCNPPRPQEVKCPPELAQGAMRKKAEAKIKAESDG